jgi:DNA-binding LytR/AlgR family response regulator
VRHFLTKPVDKNSLVFVLKKMIKELDEAENAKDFIVAREKGNQIKIPISRISKIEIEGNYSTVVTATGKRYVLKASLAKVHGKLDQQQFVRCHRSTVVNFDYASSLDNARNKLILKNGEEISLGNRFRSKVKKMFNDMQI